MGLIDDRAVNAYRDSVFPRWKQQLERYLGFTVSVEVDWKSLAIPGMSHWCFQHLTEVFFLPLSYAIEQVCYDDLGREALRNQLDSVVVRNSRDNSSSDSMVSFENGVLTIDHAPHINVQEIYRRTEVIRECLETHL